MLILFSRPATSAAGEEPASVVTLLEKNDSASLSSLKSHDSDGRTGITALYKAYLKLSHRYHWKMEQVFADKVVAGDGKAFELPSLVFTSPVKGPALWILTGIHGEEPAGPCALADNTDYFASLAEKGIPIVIFPLLNPEGYCRNSRYPGARAGDSESSDISVGDSEHLLPDDSGKPRREEPTSARCDAVTGRVLELCEAYPPKLVLDFHEDDTLDKGYLYSQGKAGKDDTSALAIIAAFKEKHFPLELNGKISDDEIIRDGIISDVKDGSIDELLASGEIVPHGIRQPGPSAPCAIVIETGSKNVPLPQRVKVHSHIMRMAEKLWNSVGR